MTRLAAMASLEEVLSTVGWTPVIRDAPQMRQARPLSPRTRRGKKQGKARQYSILGPCVECFQTLKCEDMVLHIWIHASNDPPHAPDLWALGQKMERAFVHCTGAGAMVPHWCRRTGLKKNYSRQNQQPAKHMSWAFTLIRQL